mgnify:CR=1 FL=1
MNKFLIIIFLLFNSGLMVFANPNIQARTAILIDYYSDEILYEMDPDAQIYPCLLYTSPSPRD